MASNLVGGECLGQHSVCLIRVASLDDDCSPLGGADSGAVSLGIATFTATADVEEGRRLEPKNGCGQVSFLYEEPNVIKRYNISGELNYHDLEMKKLMFGGELITGNASSDFVGDTIGYAERHYTDVSVNNGVYLEVIVRNAAATTGECGSGGGAGAPYATGYIFGKAKLASGDLTADENNSVMTFTGTAVGNPNLFDGPWNDYPGVGYIPNSPKVEIQYSQTEYEAILATAACGFVTLPAAS